MALSVEEKRARRLESMAEKSDPVAEPEPPEDGGEPGEAEWGDPETDDEAAMEAGDPPQNERRARLLAGIPADVAALITDAELDEIETEEREKAEAERKDKALAAVRKGVRQRARVDNDLIDPSVVRSAEDRKRLAHKVDFRFELPEGGDAIDGFRIDGHIFQNRVWHMNYPMAVVESLRANFYRTHLSEVQFSQMNQDKKGRRADQLLARNPPVFEVRDAA